jgi:DNA replication protein DnaC
VTATSTENICEGCGHPARVFEVMGVLVPMRFCEGCADIEHEREEADRRDRSLERSLRRAGGTTRLLTMSLDTHPDTAAVKAATAWIAGWQRGDRHNLWLAGPVGLGKTGLAWSIVRELVTGSVERYWETPADERDVEPRIPALMIRWADLLDDLRAAFDRDRHAQTSGDYADPSLLLERAKQVGVLALDDLGRERPTPWALERLANLVETRYGEMRPTIVTSNYGSRDLIVRLDPSGVDGERIVDRLVHDAVPFRFDGVSRRTLA